MENQVMENQMEVNQGGIKGTVCSIVTHLAAGAVGVVAGIAGKFFLDKHREKKMMKELEQEE